MENSKLTKFQNIKNYIYSHKTISVVVLMAVIILGYFGDKLIFKATAETSYVTSTVVKGSVFVSVAGSGQVESSSSIDLKAKTSSYITYVSVKAGDVVRKGKLLFSLDSKDAERSVRDAELSLASSKLSLEKLENQNSEENISADLNKAYEDGFNDVSNAFLDLPTVLTGLESILVEQNLSDNSARMVSKTARDYRNKAEELYYKANNSFFINQKNYRLLTRDGEVEKIEEIINETYETTKLISDAVKSYRNFVDYMADETDRPSDYTSYQNTLGNYTSTINSHLSNLLSTRTNIEDYKDNSTNGGLDIESSILGVKQKENSLQDAKDALADYYVYAPFDGTISSVTAKVGDIASGTLATIITKQKIATISLNEVDIAKIKLGQKATLTFDAIDTLSITGEVSEIDSIGAVSQGVVSYNVKISFDVSDDRVKPGMSVSASIITDIVQDVLIIPNNAVKNQNGVNFVQTFDTPLVSSSISLQGAPSTIPPKQTEVVIGLVDDTNTEIILGLKEGDIIVTKTIAGSNTTVKSTAPSLMSAVGGNKTTGGTGGARMGIPHD